MRLPGRAGCWAAGRGIHERVSTRRHGDSLIGVVGMALSRLPGRRPSDTICRIMFERTNDPAAKGGASINDPLLSTPVARLLALAMGTGVRVFDVPAVHSVGLAGLVGVSLDKDGEPQCSMGLTDDLDNDLRADVLAFGLAVLVGTPEILDESPDGILGSVGSGFLRPATVPATWPGTCCRRAGVSRCRRLSD